MSNPIASILRAASRKEDEPLNILTCPTHEAYETNLCKTGHNFFAVRSPQVKDWNSKYRPLPDNYVLLNPHKQDKQLPPEIDFDVILSQNKFGQFQVLQNLSRLLHVPMISLEHTLPPNNWPTGQIDALKNMRGHLNLFISEYSREKWGWKPEEALVIHHGIDTELFKPHPFDELFGKSDRENHLLSVVNDWINRDWCCGFNLWQEVSKGINVKVVGDTPGLSKPAPNTEQLIAFYRNARVFLNTSLISPVPTSLLEAMACGCAIVSTATCMIPEIIENGKNGYISNNPQELRNYCQLLLGNKELCNKMGEAARQTILERFSLDAFTKNWNKILRNASNLVYRG